MSVEFILECLNVSSIQMLWTSLLKGVTHDCLSDWKSEELNFNAACYLDMYPIDCLPIIVICADSQSGWSSRPPQQTNTELYHLRALSPVSSITMMWFAGCSFKNLVSMSEKYYFEPYVCFTSRTGGSKELHLEHKQLGLSHDYMSAVYACKTVGSNLGRLYVVGNLQQCQGRPNDNPNTRICKWSSNPSCLMGLCFMKVYGIIGPGIMVLDKSSSIVLLPWTILQVTFKWRKFCEYFKKN